MVLKPRAEAPQWVNEENPEKSAKCIKFPPTREYDPWFEEDELAAAAICNGDYDGKVCYLRDQCLEWSILNNEQYGVWGGMLEHDRLNMRLARRQNPYMEVKWHPPTPKDPPVEDEYELLDLIELVDPE